jgi:hypothetical protein
VKINPKETSNAARINASESIPESCDITPKSPEKKSESDIENEAVKKAKLGEFGTVETPAGRRSARLANKQASATPKKVK